MSVAKFGCGVFLDYGRCFVAWNYYLLDKKARRWADSDTEDEPLVVGVPFIDVDNEMASGQCSSSDAGASRKRKRCSQ